MVHVALVGGGHIHTPGFVKRLQNRPDVTVKAVWDHDTQRAQRWAGELGCPAFSEIDRIWADNEIRAVVVGAETNRHEPLVLAGAAAGKHLFVEKPLGLGAQDAYRMARAIESAGVLFQTGYFLRGDPIHQFLREQLSAGSFGRVTRLPPYQLPLRFAERHLRHGIPLDGRPSPGGLRGVRRLGYPCP